MDTVFEAATLNLSIPECSARSKCDATDPSAGEGEHERDVAFFDERLTYYLSVFVPLQALSYLRGEPEQAMGHFVKRIQRSMIASFLPLQSSRPVSDTRQPYLQPGPSGSASASEPSTPNPYPAMRGGQEEYAEVEGTTVWEGEVRALPIASGGSSAKALGDDEAGKLRTMTVIRQVEGGYEAVWEGEVPIAYVRTPIANPLLALTASITLRPDHHLAAHQSHMSHFSLATGSGDSDAELDTGEDFADCGDAEMHDVDLLGGLAGAMPGLSRGRHRQSDTTSSPRERSTPYTGSNQQEGLAGDAHGQSDAEAIAGPVTSTLRKSFRRILALSPGLRVRMRNLVLPQLLPPGASDESEPEEGLDGEKKVVLCVEIENTPDENAPAMPFVVERVEVDIGGKGGKATAELTCQPGSTPAFPLRLQPMEQYNLLYGVSVAFTTDDAAWEEDQTARAVLRNLGSGEVNRPVSIIVVGRPYYTDDSRTERYPTKEFNSRWNCNLDLSAYYASLPSASALPAATAGPSKSRLSRTGQPSAIVGDKRYSLATLLAGDRDDPQPQQLPSTGPRQGSRPPSLALPKRLISSRPLMPSQLASTAASNRLSSVHSVGTAGHSDEMAGLMISVQLLEDEARRSNGEERSTIQALREFSIEVYVNNRTEEVRRFRLSVPGQGEASGMQDSIQARRKEGTAVMDDPALRHSLASQIASSPGIISMEDDVRCGPLLPGSSLSARMRFMALRDGVHRIEKLRVTGIGDDLDFIVSPVLDVVVGSGGLRT